MATLLSLLFLFLVFLIPRYIKYRRYIKHLERYPNPPIVPILGNALDFRQSTDVIPTITKYTKLYGDIIKVYLGPFPNTLLISNYKLIEYILNSHTILNKGIEYQYLYGWLGKGLLISNGDSRWKKHRKLFLPAFHVQKFQEFLQVFESNTLLLVKKLEKELESSTFDVQPYIQLCSLDMICETAMGTSIYAQNQSDSDYVKSVKVMCEIFIKRVFNPILSSDFIYHFTNEYRREKRALKILHAHTTKVIENRRREFHQGADNQDAFDQCEKKMKLTLLDSVLEKSNSVLTLNDTAIREEMETFMFAGHDTTSVALSFVIFCLSEHSKIQDKVVEEIKEIFADDINRPVTLHDIGEMKYLEAVIKEALRLYPPVPQYARTVDEDFEFDGGVIPKGITLLFNIYSLHRNPEYFPDPDSFRPERHLGDNNGNAYPYAYLPFSTGPRSCIGQKFAMVEMKCLLSILLRNYEFVPPYPRREPVLAAEIVLTSHNGINVRINKRK